MQLASATATTSFIRALFSMCEMMAAILLRTGLGRSAYMALCPANSGQASNRSDASTISLESTNIHGSCMVGRAPKKSLISSTFPSVLEMFKYAEMPYRHCLQLAQNFWIKVIGLGPTSRAHARSARAIAGGNMVHQRPRGLRMQLPAPHGIASRQRPSARESGRMG